MFSQCNETKAEQHKLLLEIHLKETLDKDLSTVRLRSIGRTVSTKLKGYQLKFKKVRTNNL